MAGSSLVPQQRFVAGERKGSEALRLTICGALVLLGSSVLVGWFLQIEPLKSVIPGMATMKANTAWCFILAGLGLATIGRNSAGRWVATACALLILATALLTLAEYASRRSLGIDELLIADRGSLRGSGHPGRMSPLTALAWSALAPAMLLLAWSRRRG